ncbi:hypothetical protein RB200_35730 [Streptomyces sp. PmtG]
MTPKTLRHSMALRTLVALDRRLGLTPAERLHYEEVYGQVWLMVKDMLRHRSEQVTRNAYLEPVRGPRLESLLGGNGNPVIAEKIAELAARTGLTWMRRKRPGAPGGAAADGLPQGAGTGLGQLGHPPGQRCREAAGPVGLRGQPRTRRLPASAGDSAGRTPAAGSSTPT